MVAYKNQIRIGEATTPTRERSADDPTKSQAIFYDEGNKRYYFSNELGHKVIAHSTERPMEKQEYKNIYDKMVRVLLENPSDEPILDEIVGLNFDRGHANSTFEVTRPCQCTTEAATQIFNRGTNRYIYNSDNNTVYYSDGRLNGSFLAGEEKESIIKVLTKSKTMQRKLQSK